MIRTIALFLIACAAVGQLSAQKPVNCSGPLSEKGLTDLIKGEVPPKRLQLFVTQCGLDFTLTSAEEERLRKAGASAAFLALVREKIELQAETALWESIKDSQEIASFDDFLQRYPRGQFVVQANQAIQRLKSLKISRAIEAGDKAISAGDWDAATAAAANLRELDPGNVNPARWESKIADVREAARRAEAGQERARRQQREENDARERKELEGLWRSSVTLEGNFPGGDRKRYRGQSVKTLQITSGPTGLSGVWKESRTLTVLNRPGATTRHYEAAFRITRSGASISGLADSARKRDNEGAWQVLADVRFEGQLRNGSLELKIAWVHDVELSAATLTRLNALEAAAEERETRERNEMDGTWRGSRSWEGSFRNGGSTSLPMDRKLQDLKLQNVERGLYRAQSVCALQITDEATGLSGVLSETVTFKYTEREGGFTRHYEATFPLKRSGSVIAGQVEFARTRDNEGAWRDVPGAVFEGHLRNGVLHYKATWWRDGDETAGTLTRLDAAKQH
jgi:hypothetical protein